jgi:hypothetical protein
MKIIYNWYNGLSKRFRDSITIPAVVVGAFSTVLSILGISLGDWENSNIWTRVGIVLFSYLLICIITYLIIGGIFRDSINLRIRETPVSITCGDIFQTVGWKVIGCDTCFRTVIDDVVISKESLHGQLVIDHGDKGK